MLRDLPTLRLGQVVAYGQVIAHSGSSGALRGVRYAPHHHHGVSELGHYYDPMSIGFPQITSTPLEDDMTPEQDARLKNVEAILGGLQNAIGDPNRGILKSAYAAEQNSARGLTMLQTIQNWIEDPERGIHVRLSKVIELLTKK